MAYRKATLRIMPPVTRKLARILNDAESAVTRLKHQLDNVSGAEVRSIALDEMTKRLNAKNEGAPILFSDFAFPETCSFCGAIQTLLLSIPAEKRSYCIVCFKRSHPDAFRDLQRWLDEHRVLLT